MSGPVENAEKYVRQKARPHGFEVSAHDSTGHRRVIVTSKDGETAFEVRLSPRSSGFVAGVMRDGDHALQGMPHRTGSHGVLEPVEERIVTVDMSDLASCDRYAGMIESEVARCNSVRTPADRQDALAHRVQKLIDHVTADPETAKTALAKALDETLGPSVLERLFEAVDQHLETSSPSFR